MSLIGKLMFANNPSDMYSGDNINLIIEIENQEKVFIKEMFVHFSGEINCLWDDLVNKNREGEILYVMQVFRDRQILVDKHLTIISSDVLNKGKHVYNAVLHIPEQLPESVMWKYGCVRYELQLRICSAKGEKTLFEMPLNVKRYLNICLDREYMQPFHTILKKAFCWGICQTSPLKIILTLPKTYFLPGDSLKYFIKIENFCKILDVQQISILLTQTQHYEVGRPTKRVKQVHTTLKQLRYNFAENHHNSKLNGLLVLPKNLVPSSPIACFLSASYNLHFIFIFTGFQTDGFVSVPLKIGSHMNSLQKLSALSKGETVLEISAGGEKIDCEV